MNMQVIECKPAFVPDELFVLGVNPSKDASAKSSPAQDTSTMEVPFTKDSPVQHSNPAGAPSTPLIQSIPGLENHECIPSCRDSALVCLCRARGVMAERPVADVPSCGVENEKKRKFQEKEDLQSEGTANGAATHRRKLTDVSAVDDLSCYLGDEVSPHVCNDLDRVCVSQWSVKCL